MRRAHWLVAAGLTAVGSMLWVTGCSTFGDDCANGNDEQCNSLKSSGTGGSPPKPVACEGDPTTDPEKVHNDCGVFVHANAAAGGDGSMTKPFATLQEAIDKADESGKTKWIFACTDSAFSEAVTISLPRQIYGGFDCTTDPSKWAWVEGKKTVLSTPASTVPDAMDDVIAVRVESGASGTIIDALEIISANADKPGGSSIAMLVNGAMSMEVKRSDLIAGNGMPGDDGMMIADDAALNGLSGNMGVNTCSTGLTSPGGAAVTKDCSMTGGGMSIGGKGGDGGSITAMTLDPGGNGDFGSPGGMPNQGSGEEQMACTDGTNGAAGTQGKSGAGASGMGLLSKYGYEGAKGLGGDPGTPGQGGGGGGGAKGGFAISCNGGASVPRLGASGGSGATGGCGGKGGNPGSPGGSSIALASLNAAVSLTGVKLTAGLGGNGGAGGLGQYGGQTGPSVGVGGLGAGLANSACNGAKGGKGGTGGQGGGGQGGHSLGIAYTGTAPTLSDSTIQREMMGGTGGLGADMAGKGADGQAADTLEF